MSECEWGGSTHTHRSVFMGRSLGGRVGDHTWTFSSFITHLRVDLLGTNSRRRLIALLTKFSEFLLDFITGVF